MFQFSIDGHPSDFMIQSGDHQNVKWPGYQIKESSWGGLKMILKKHERGVISMARSGHQGSAGSQFFIMHNDSHLI